MHEASVSEQRQVRLSVENLTSTYDGEGGARDVSMTVREGEFVGLIGPNGSGKTTVLKTIYRALKPDAGRIVLDGQDLTTMTYRESAKKIAVVGQENDVPFDFLVSEIVAMGRSPHKRLFSFDTRHDKAVVKKALDALGMGDLAHKSFAHLSGGQKQRALIARALAQEANFYVLDEPTNHLDIGYQLQIFNLVASLGVTVVSAVHDLNLAALYCDRLYAMEKGRLVLEGTPEEVLTEANIKRLYGVTSRVRTSAETGKLSIEFLPERAAEGRDGV